MIVVLAGFACRIHVCTKIVFCHTTNPLVLLRGRQKHTVERSSGLSLFLVPILQQISGPYRKSRWWTDSALSLTSQIIGNTRWWFLSLASVLIFPKHRVKQVTIWARASSYLSVADVKITAIVSALATTPISRNTLSRTAVTITSASVNGGA